MSSIKVKVMGQKVTLGPCRVCYVSLFERKKWDNDQGEGKYGITVLIPKDDEETAAKIKKAIAAVADSSETMAKVWKGRKPQQLFNPLQDGDAAENPGSRAGWLYLNAKTNFKPMVVDKYGQPITDPEEVYSGMWAAVSLNLFAYKTGSNAGIGVSLNGVKKIKDDERLGGGGCSASEFDEFTADDEDDDLY